MAPDATDRPIAQPASSARRPARCACAGRCCRSPTSTGSSSSPAACASSAWRSSPPAAPRASSPAAGIAVRAIEDFTGFPEIMDGRVKTLHPRLYAGLLARRDEDAHLRAAAEQEIEQVDLVCVNLYPFEQTRRARRRPRGGDRREHRHRRSDDDQGGGQEQRVRGGGRGPGRLRARARRAARVRRQAVAGHAHGAGGQGVRVHRPLRRGDRHLVRARARTRASRRPGATPTRRSATCATARTRTSRPPSTRAWARPRTCSRASSSCTARSCRSTTCSTSAPRASWSRTSHEPACAIVKHNNPCGCAVAASGQRGLRTRLRVRPAERLRRRDRGQPAGRPRVRRGAGASSSSRCCSRPATTRTRWRCCR